ncbi:aspartyl-phosphate phosphatase Spo0E family protein [Paenibacillaceae bacterium]|nr:aspartyl-phosphate phosphatase Spo0E family protein [Paenibacillaceae bacterium]
MDEKSVKQLEGLRRQLVHEANRRQTLLHHEVLNISQRLDQLIYKAQVEMSMKADNRLGALKSS